jgi:hypothetical protein
MPGLAPSDEDKHVHARLDVKRSRTGDRRLPLIFIVTASACSTSRWGARPEATRRQWWLVSGSPRRGPAKRNLGADSKLRGCHLVNLKVAMSATPTKRRPEPSSVIFGPPTKSEPRPTQPEIPGLSSRRGWRLVSWARIEASGASFLECALMARMTVAKSPTSAGAALPLLDVARCSSVSAPGVSARTTRSRSGFWRRRRHRGRLRRGDFRSRWGCGRFVRHVVSDCAPGGRAQDGVMAGNVTAHGSHCGALETALRRSVRSEA